MCGIFGLIQKEGYYTAKIFRDLFILSESRGKEASGYAYKSNGVFNVLKTPFPASCFVKSRAFNNYFKTISDSRDIPFLGIGHSRLVTNGYEQFDNNNQPVVKNGMIVIHNGIIVNQSELWQKYDAKKKESDLDSELIPEIISNGLLEGLNLGEAIGRMFNEIYGMTNIALLSNKYNNLLLSTNNGSIFYINDLNNGFFVFASERYIIKQLLKKRKLNYSVDLINQLEPGTLVSINLKSFSFNLLSIGEKIVNLELQNKETDIVHLKDIIPLSKIHINTSLEHVNCDVSSLFIDEFLKRKAKIDELRRCTKCVLPETFPHIEFDEKGVCNYCNNYSRINILGKEALLTVADKYRRKDGKPECLVPFSGGRDSSFALHYVVEELKLKPIAFSYDWGMLTDLARRNQARMCGSLGIEHILVSADIRKKRENIRKNVSAWLRRPDLGIIPLFMAGDKQYFFYASELMNQNELKLSVLGENILETTNFKSGFCGIKPKFVKDHTYSLSTFDKLKMLAYYGRQYFLNTAYINSSFFDTIDSFKSYYIIKHDNLNIYDFLKWDEKEIVNVLVNKYDWETDPETNSTWRIGDGTAAFYNYIYYMIAGFTENDTFRSNQVREQCITRVQALELSFTENLPRWDSIKWYCNTIGIDFTQTINTINKMKKLY